MRDQYSLARLSMKGLVEATGLHRQTIHSYLREGLLPPPVEGAGTRRARYGEVHVDLVRLIRELREARGMSLAAIRRVFEAAGFDPAAIRRELRGGAAPPGPVLDIEGPELLDADALAEEADAPRSLVDGLAEAGAVKPDRDDPEERFDREAVQVVAAAHRLVEQGTDRGAVVRMARLCRSLVGVETSILMSDAADSPDGLDAVTRRAERRHRAIGDLVASLRRAAVRRALRRLAEVGPRSLTFAHDAIYVPSPLFVQRYGLDDVLREVEARASAAPDDPSHALRMGRLLLGLGRYDEAEPWLQRGADLAPDDAVMWSHLGITRAIAGHVGTGLDACQRAVDLARESPRARTFLGAALGLAAAHTSGLDDGADALRRALRVAEESRDLEPADTLEHMEVLLARGRLFTVLPRQLPGHAEGVADLEEVLERTTGTTDADNGFEFPGTNALYRIHALFYLGISAFQEGAAEQARRLLRQCITEDPSSHFATRAYELLSRLEDA
ncbi:MAG: MerR family transcriptional regulator [Myxococcota bacterium]